MPSTYLAHHGILGQKWGVRRYQNPDGSLTEAGKKRYLKADGSFKKNFFGGQTKYDRDNYKTRDTYYTRNGRGDLTSAGQKRYERTLKDLKTANARAYLSTYKGSKARQVDLTYFGPTGVERIAKRLDKGDSYQAARVKEVLYRSAKIPLDVGKVAAKGAEVTLGASTAAVVGLGALYAGAYYAQYVKPRRSDYNSKKAAGLLLSPAKVFNTDTRKWVTL